MELNKIIGVLVLFLRIVSGDNLTLFPVGGEVVYQWEAKITTGTVLPDELNATWEFSALLFVQQPSDNVTVFKVSDVHGASGDVLEAIEKPFKVSYVAGQLTSLFVDPSDEIWSINMKRALASLIQLKLESIKIPAFITEENGLYGKCTVEYVGIPDGTYLTIRKVLDHNSCDGLPKERFSSSPVLKCQKDYQDMTMSDSERQFKLNLDSDVKIRNITSTGRVLVQPYKATSEAHYSKSSQSLGYLSHGQIEKEILIDPAAKEVELAYEHLDIDPTYGKAPNNRSVIIKKINKLFEELTDSLTNWEVGVKGLNNQTSFYILDLMWWLDTEGWEELYGSITLGTSYTQETIQHFFWELVPKAGSHSAALFIRDLITTNRVKDLLAGYLLMNFPFYIKEPTEELLMQCEELLNLNKAQTEIKDSAILSFASLVRKTCSIGCQPDTLDKYAKLYLNRFTESDNYKDKMLYLQALSNLELNQALDFLIPVIVDKTSSNSHIRFLAAWATLHTTLIEPGKVYEVYWPIFTNSSESLELRVTALTMLFISNPTPARFFSLYWYMQSEPSEQLYNFYYTTIQSIAKTNFPCYASLAPVAGKLVRFVPAKSRQWATGNYILDFEDHDRDYGVMLQLLLIASEQSGLPNVFMFITEQHAMGYSREYSLYLKIEGVEENFYRQLDNISGNDNGNNNKNKNDKLSMVFKLLMDLKIPLKVPKDLHLEIIFKVDGMAVISQYVNETSFNHWAQVIRKVISAYSQFSLNHQGINFPLLVSIWGVSDLGTPTLLQIRSSALTSARGSINQQTEGQVRNAELDLRFSWNGLTSLRVYSPFDNNWYGADRCRNLHIRVPFATQLILHVKKSFIKATAVRHRDFVAGSRLGMVWHSSTRLTTTRPVQRTDLHITDEWSMDSEDLGVRLGAGVFDCPNPDTLTDALHVLKGAFLADSKNYHMIPGGVVILGLLSIKDQLQFQPYGSRCGVMLYISPVLNQVEPVLLVEGSHISLSMVRQDGILWEMNAGSKRLHDGYEEFSFKLYRAPSVSVTEGNIWRVINMEGAFIVPLRMSGVFNLPAAVTGYAVLSWGDSSPSNAEKAAKLDLRLIPGRNDSTALYCKDYTPRCLQSTSDLAARQTASLQYSNLPGWLKMAAHALFPEHIQTESTRTQVTFAYPAALLPWNTKGLCAMNQNSVLTLDNATLSVSLPEDYVIAVGDCSQETQFLILVKKQMNLLGAKLYCGDEIVELLPDENGVVRVSLNGNYLENIKPEYQHIVNEKSQFHIRLKAAGAFEVELRSGVILQHYNTTLVTLIPAQFRGYTCGMCGDFNGDTNNDQQFPKLIVLGQNITTSG